MMISRLFTMHNHSTSEWYFLNITNLHLILSQISSCEDLHTCAGSLWHNDFLHTCAGNLWHNDLLTLALAASGTTTFFTLALEDERTTTLTPPIAMLIRYSCRASHTTTIVKPKNNVLATHCSRARLSIATIKLGLGWIILLKLLSLGSYYLMLFSIKYGTRLP